MGLWGKRKSSSAELWINVKALSIIVWGTLGSQATTERLQEVTWVGSLWNSCDLESHQKLLQNPSYKEDRWSNKRFHGEHPNLGRNTCGPARAGVERLVPKSVRNKLGQVQDTKHCKEAVENRVSRICYWLECSLRKSKTWFQGIRILPIYGLFI